MATDEGFSGLNFRFPCYICNRQFAPEALERHLKICEKTSQKQRKAFDSAKQRIQGTDIPTVSNTPLKAASPPPRKNKPPKAKKLALRQKQNAFQDGSPSGKGPTAAPSTLRNRQTSELVQCPTCERNFNEKAAERHISWCREQYARIPRSPPCTDAKVRLVTRVQYRAPLPGKRRNSPPRTFPLSKSWSQLSQPNVNSTISPTSPTIQHGVKVTGTAMTTHHRANEAKKSPQTPSLSNYVGDGSNSLGGSNGMIHSTSWEWVTPNSTLERPSKKSTNGNSKLLPKRSVNLASKKRLVQLESPKTEDGYDPYISAQRQMEELMLGTSGPTSPITPKPVQPNNRVSTNQVRENKLRSNPSTLSLNSDHEHDMEEIEEMIEDLAFEDDPKFEEILIPMNRKNRHPRRAVSREEALFGTKTSSGSQDSDYGSLLMQRSPSSPARLSPAQRKHGRNCDIIEHNLLTSTSSSETSLPPLGLKSEVTKLPRFCHACGTKYPVANAKFCCECGIKRILTSA